MQVKKEPGDEGDGLDSNDPLLSDEKVLVPDDDVSLNTPQSNPPPDDEDMEDLDPNNDASASEPKQDQEEGDEASKVKSEEVDKKEDDDAGIDGGDLEGSVTEEGPPETPFDDDDDVVDDEPAVPEPEAEHEEPSDEQNKDSSEFRTESNNEEGMEPEEAPEEASEDVPEAANDDNNAVVNENGQNSLDSSSLMQSQDDTPEAQGASETADGVASKETTAEDDLLASTEATNMEEGDEQYKNMIAESQMDNIFN